MKRRKYMEMVKKERDRGREKWGERDGERKKLDPRKSNIHAGKI